MTAEEIRAPSDSNRFVSWPYTKAMCANNNVDQAGALIICSTEAADRLGVDPDQRVYPHHCISSADTASLIGRHDLSSAPGLEAAAALLRREVGDIDEIAHLDLYSCFPAVVSLTSGVLGLSPDRPLTVTGGLAFAGAPINFAAGQSLIGMVSALRSDPGSLGLVHGNGGHIAKHTFGTYSTVPPTRPHRSLTAANDAPTRVAADPDRSGRALLDGITVAYDHNGPSRAIGLVRFEDGSRTWATSTDSELMAECTEQEWVGREIDVDAGSLRF
jgi:acetyl-CoA C-acetyltransferase